MGKGHQAGVKVDEEDSHESQNGEDQRQCRWFQTLQGHALLNACLIRAEHRCPVEEATDQHGEETVSSCGIGIETEMVGGGERLMGNFPKEFHDNSLEKLQPAMFAGGFEHLRNAPRVMTAQGNDDH